VVPDSLLGLALFVALLSPGFVYLQARERRHPGLDYSVLRETSVVVVTSVVTTSIAAGLLWVARAIAPGLTPDVGSYVRDNGDHDYLKAHYAEAATWSIVMLVVASLLAWWAAIPPQWLGVGPLVDWVLRRRGDAPIEQVSGRAVAFGQHPKHRKIIEAALTDGSSVFGTLASRATQIKENDERDLVLVAPLQVRERGGEWTKLPTAGTVVISASRIKYLVVTYEQIRGDGSRPDDMIDQSPVTSGAATDAGTPSSV
jgi:hypothetical protein